MNLVEGTDYNFITEEYYSLKRDNPGTHTIARIIFYAKPLQEEIIEMIYLEIADNWEMAEIKKLLKEVRKESHPQAESYREEVIIQNTDNI